MRTHLAHTREGIKLLRFNFFPGVATQFGFRTPLPFRTFDARLWFKTLIGTADEIKFFFALAQLTSATPFDFNAISAREELDLKHCE